MASVADTPLLRLFGASRRVADRTLWQNLSLELAPGDRLVVDGASGTGKSLLLRGIAGLDELDGACEFRGRPQSGWPMPEYRAQVMYVPQSGALAGGVVADVLRAPFALAAQAGRTYSDDAAENLLAVLGRDPALLAAETENLSGGELQSVLLVRALLLEPTVLLLDEITAALDAELAARAEEVLIDWVNAGERALIWVGHDSGGRQRMGTASVEIGARS